MTLDEAKAVAKIVEGSEGGCKGCINEALKELNETFPGFNWMLVSVAKHDAAIEVVPIAKKPVVAPYIRTRC